MPIYELASDPAFLALPPEEQRKGLAETDPGFAALPHEEQMKGVADLTGRTGVVESVDDAGNATVDGEDSAAKRLNNPNFGIKTPEDLRREMALTMQPVIDDMGTTKRAIVGVGAGMYDAYKGVQQAGAEVGQSMGLVKPETVQRITQEGQDARDAFAPLKAQSTAATLGEFGGKIAPYLAVPVGGATGGLARFAAGAGAGATMGALDFVPEGGSRGTNALIGGVLGGGGAAALSGAGKLYNAAAENPLAKFATQKLSDKFKIPVTLSELTGKANRTDTIMERVPSFFGIKGFRETQQSAAKNAATSHFGQYVIDPTMDNTAAMKVANDAHLDELYNVVRQNATHLPQATAPEVKAAATELLDRYPAVFETIQDSHVKRILSNIKGDMATNSVNVGVLNSRGQNITRQIEPKFSFDDLWTLRKGIGQAMGGARTPTETAQLSRVYAAVSDDMDTMLTGKGGDALSDFKTANDAFKKYSLKFEAMREVYDKSIGTIGAGTPGYFSPQKYGTALKSLANDPKYKKNIVWSAGEVEQMTGLANILQVTKRAGQFMENPPNGNRLGIPSALGVGAGGYAMGFASTVKTAGLTGVAALITKFITTTQAGQRLALSASRIEPTSLAMSVLMKQVYQQVPKMTAAMELGSDNQAPMQQTYDYTHPLTGKKISITGDTPPSGADLKRIFAETAGQKDVSQYSDAELAAIAQQGDMSKYSDAELEAIAGQAPKKLSDPLGIRK